MPRCKVKTRTTYIVYGQSVARAGRPESSGSCDVTIKRYSVKHTMVYIVSEKIRSLLSQVAPLVEQYYGIEKEITENVRQLAERVGHRRAIVHGLPDFMPRASDFQATYHDINNIVINLSKIPVPTNERLALLSNISEGLRKLLTQCTRVLGHTRPFSKNLKGLLLNLGHSDIEKPDLSSILDDFYGGASTDSLPVGLDGTNATSVLSLSCSHAHDTEAPADVNETTV